MACPALRTFLASTSTSFDFLTSIQMGDAFVVRGYEYRADGEAATTEANGRQMVTIQAWLSSAALSSGRELSTVMEMRPLV